MRINFLVLLSLLLSTNNAVADCQSVRPVLVSDLNIANSELLFKNMIAACKSGVPENFFALQSKKTNYLLRNLSSSQKREAFSQYCSFTQEATKTLGGRPESGVHTFKQDSYKTTECGQKMSFWYIHTKEGALALRLEATLEDSQLKIDTH